MTTTALAHSTTTDDAPTTRPRTAARWAAGGYLADLRPRDLRQLPRARPGAAARRRRRDRRRAARLRDPSASARSASSASSSIDVVVAWALFVLFRPVHRDLSLPRRVVPADLHRGARAPRSASSTPRSGWPTPPAPSATRDDDASCWRCRPSTSPGWSGWPPSARTSWCWACCCSRARGPRWIVWLLVAAGAAYVVDTVAHLVLADYESLRRPLPRPRRGAVGDRRARASPVWLLLVATGRRPAPAVRRA